STTSSAQRAAFGMPASSKRCVSSSSEAVLAETLPVAGAAEAAGAGAAGAGAAGFAAGAGAGAADSPPPHPDRASTSAAPARVAAVPRRALRVTPRTGLIDVLLVVDAGGPTRPPRASSTRL